MVSSWLLRRLHHIAHQAPRTDFGAIDNAVFVDRYSFGRARRVGFMEGGGKEIFHRTILGAADADAAFPAVVVFRHRFGLGIGDIDGVVLIDIDSAWTAALA